MLKLKLQYFDHLMRRTDSLEKTLNLGKLEGRRRRGWQRMWWLDGNTDSMDMSLVNSRSWWWTGRPGVLWFMGSQRVRHDWATELNWTEQNGTFSMHKSENMLYLCACSVAQSYLILCDPLDYSISGCSVHGILQARILEWIAISSWMGSSLPRDWTCVSCISCIGRQILYHWATWEALFFTFVKS